MQSDGNFPAWTLNSPAVGFKNKVLVVVILLLNLSLFGVGYFFFNRLSSEITRMAHPNASPPDIRERLRLAKTSKTSTKVPETAPNGVLFVTNRFHWSQIESSDYREYITNLRSVGCPEATIKDIIMTDIMRLYAVRRGEFYHNGRQFRFWETNEKRKLNARQLEEREKQLALIDKEIPSVMRELLGINYEREINKYFVDANDDARRLDFLSDDKREQLLALRDELDTMKERILEESAEGGMTDETRAALAEFEDKRRQRLAKLLTPAELDEFELRTSETADRLREQLVGFNPTEREFRSLYDLQKAVDDRYAFANIDDPAVQAEKEALQAKVDDAVRVQLGEQRYGDYRQAQSPDYRNACLFTELYELPSSAASSIYEIQQIAQRERQNLLGQNIPEDRLYEALEAIKAETERSLLEILGNKVLSNYTQSSGKWVGELGTPN